MVLFENVDGNTSTFPTPTIKIEPSKITDAKKEESNQKSQKTFDDYMLG